MNKTFYSAKDHSLFVRPISLVLFLLSTLIAFLGALLLFNTPVIGNVATAIINIGLDPLRAQLVAALLLVAGAALVGAALGRQRVGAIIGAGIAFWPGYLANFIHLEQQPAYDPGGRLEALDQQALLHTAIVMVALALLSGFIGAAVGKAVGEVLLEPFYQLGALTWNRFFRPARATSLWATKATTPLPTRPRTALEMTGSWLGVVIMVILIVLASGSGDLLLFSPDVGLHSVPTQSKTHDTPVQGAVVEDSLASPAAGGQKRAFLIYLPPSYSTPQGRTRRYPTLYLLHGSPGSQRDWFTGGKAAQSADTLIAQGEIPELIMISPDGNGRSGETSEWGNSFDKRQNIETFVAVDLVNYVDHKYQTVCPGTGKATYHLPPGCTKWLSCLECVASPALSCADLAAVAKMTSEISHTSIINGQHLSYRAGSSWSSSRALKRGNYIDSLRLAIVQQNTKIIRAKISNLIEKAVNADHTQGGQHVY